MVLKRLKMRKKDDDRSFRSEFKFTSNFKWVSTFVKDSR